MMIQVQDNFAPSAVITAIRVLKAALCATTNAKLVEDQITLIVSHASLAIIFKMVSA